MTDIDVTLNAWEPNFVQVLAVQGESEGRTINATLVDRTGLTDGTYNAESIDRPINLTDATVRLYCKKPDETQTLNDGTVTDPTNGKASFVLPKQATAVAGNVSAQIYITKADNSVLKVIGLTLQVQESDIDSIESSDEFDSLVKALNSVEAASKKAQTAVSTCNDATQAADTATSAANTATTNANTAADNANGKATLADTAARNADDKASAAQTAADNANAAAKSANDAATAANTSKTDCDTATAAANTAAQSANDKASAANTAMEAANTAASNANSKASKADTAATSANTAAKAASDAKSACDTAAQAANTATSNANTAADSANSAADKANTAAENVDKAIEGDIGPAVDGEITKKVNIAGGIAGLDANGKVSSAQLPAMDYVPTSEKGSANGVATLDKYGHVPKEQLNLNFAGHLVVHVTAADSGSVAGTKVRIRNEQLGSNYVQTIDALGNTTFSLLDNHTYYVVLLDYPSSYYGAAASVTITGGETQELTLTLDTTPDIVGWRINIDTGVIEYTDGAAAYEPMTITDGVFHAGSWDGQWAALVKPCLLKNLIPQYYLKKNSYFTVDYEHQANGTSSDIRTGADGDVMNEVALAYYKTGIETTGEGTFAYFKLAKEPQDGTWCANAYLSRSSVIQDTIYLPAYDGYVLNGKLRSLCGVAPTVNHTIGEFRSYANANGTGYEQANLTQAQYLNNLMILFFKSTDSQLAIGKGVTSASAPINTGTMNDKPLFWGDQTGTNGMKFMGIENYYGNVYKWLDGVGYLATNHFGYKIVPPFNDDRAEYADSGIAIPSTGYINRMSRANGYGMLPSATVSVEADSRYKDYFYALNSSNSIVAYGGRWGSGSDAGVFRWDDYTVSNTNAGIGASLFATPQG